MSTDIERRFPDCRESGETRVRRCQMVLLRMLKVLRFLSEHQGFRFFLYGGTLLGAVRHRGFIPWDGDADVLMLREDFDVFRTRGVPELPRDMFFQTPETDPAFPVHVVPAKLRDRYSSYTEWAAAHPEDRHHNGLQVDIFVYDRLLPAMRARLHNLLIARAPLRRARRLLGVGTLNPNMDIDYTYTAAELLPPRLLPFEDTEMPCPNRFDPYLRFKFGDYRTPPPPEEQVPHEGEADPVHPCDHPESLDWGETR